MLSRTGEHALRAMVYLAQHIDEGPVPGARIARDTRLPAKYLSNVLGSLVRAGVLAATRGIGGGFQMARSPGDVRLCEVLEPFEPAMRAASTCPFGNNICGDDTPCAGHAKWKRVNQAYARFLTETSIQDVASRPAPKRRRARRRGKKK